MIIVDNSLTIVLLGDWNKIYTQPDWIADNIFCNDEMEIGVQVQGVDFNVSYKCKNVVINPSQDKLVISATNTRKETIEFLSSCATNYITKATTPVLSAYGLNIDFIEEKNMLLSDLFDGISDAKSYINLGYEIVDSQISRSLLKNGKIINIQCNQEQAKSKIHFNEHYEKPVIEDIVLDYDNILSFIERCKEISIEFGYEFEEDDDE